MSQALAELRSPVTQEALRLRMAALHGRDDALLDPTRFPRLLRQANDAEIADVRKVGEDDYEISLHRTAALASPSAPTASRSESPAPAEPSAPTPLAEPAEVGAEAAPAPGGRDNGSRFGVRFRRGSRGSSRPGEIPLIGVVQIEGPSEESAAVVAEAAPAVAAEEAPAKKPTRTRRPPRKKAAATAAAAAAPEGGEAAPPAKRPRARAKKKAE
jgi:hypothetical protein